MTDVVQDGDWNLQGFVGFSHELRSVVVAFRGTQSNSLENWISDLKFMNTDFGELAF